MPDDRTTAKRSETMRRVRSRDTSCEMRLRSAMHTRGLRYSLRSRLPGAPDIIFTRARVAVFVDGCFWHGCPTHCRRPSSNTAYWYRKIDRNIERDRSHNEALRELGWRVIRLWEHQVNSDPDRCAARIERIVRARLARPSPMARLTSPRREKPRT